MKKKVVRKKADNSSQRAETQRQNRMRKPSTTISAKNLPNYDAVEKRARAAGRPAGVQWNDHHETLAFANRGKKPFEYAETERQMRKSKELPWGATEAQIRKMEPGTVLPYLGYTKTPFRLAGRTGPESKSYTKPVSARKQTKKGGKK